ncbi:MAG: DUF4097 family beta strand repeat-containing protein [Bacteroidetes bacterium]|nr:DUF4097 family beta strand repeat-containing protein [Bacteroidota bacterium]
MKTICRILAAFILIFILAPHAARAHDEVTKIIKKEYSVNPDAQVLFENKFGMIHINNWDKNLVSVEIKITVGASSKATADKLLDLVTIVSEGTPSSVQIRTQIGKDFSDNKKLSVDYTVNMPATLNLNLTNKFGDVFLNDLSGKGNFNLSYGNIEINKLLNSDNVIDINFGKGDVQYITGAMVSLKYSEMSVEYAGSLFVDSKFSNLDAKKIISLSMGFEGGNIDVENTSAVTGKSKFSDINIGHLETKIDLDIQYGNCDVDQISADFTLVSIRNKYGDVTINIPSGTSYTLDADLKFCDLDFPEDRATLTQKISANTSKSYRGTVGKKPDPEAKVIVKSEYGNVSLE